MSLSSSPVGGAGPRSTTGETLFRFLRRERHQAARTCPTGPRDGHQRRDSHDRLTFPTSGKA